ncbi:hypothetical protein PRK78_000012 [Emydomyces testavorans]|uniref:Kelch repeat protein n=1 Tax=Emydomyces testavorans TaxID=2070801 RepID=A0AAF0DBS0_9EURO|nr:hypothetical protein PRK78_000012 [Emydomyces testavorans]
MAFFSAAIWAIALGSLGLVSAQTFKSQVNITMCNWNQPRDGTFGGVQNDGNPRGDIFALPLSAPFDTAHTNLTGLFNRLNPVDGAAAAPNYIDGAMFSSDNEFILYGGLVRRTDAQSSPRSDETLSYERYFWGPEGVTNWKRGFVQSRTNGNVTRYITHGASVSAPSENRGYYFSGMSGKNWGEISIPEPNANYSANTLISVDMSRWREEKWTNSSLPRNITPRAKSELAWIPVSDSGLLVAIGGVPHPQDVLRPNGPTADQERANKDMGASFMKRVPVYDIASDKWQVLGLLLHYRQVTELLTTVAAAKDGSSYNIYIYGGYGGSDPEEKSSDDVYILSVPSFTWIKASQGRSEHGRRGHRCVKVFPSQMFVLGGQFIDPTTCLDGGIIQVFNLNTLEFQNVYEPAKWEDYKVPAVVTALIGGDAGGNAKVTKPSSWDDDGLATVFAKKYTKTIKTYYPYKATETSTPTPAPSGGGGGLPKWVGPVLGVVLGLILITGLAVTWLLWRRRNDGRYASSVGATSDNRKRIMRWVLGTGGPPGKPIDATTTTTEPGHPNEKYMSTGYSEVGHEPTATPHARSAVGYSDLNEAASSPVHELQDSSHPALGATVIAPLELPTEYNESPVSARPRFPSDAGSFLSPVSPEPGPVSPPASPPPEIPPSRPGHNRHNSSLSSTGFPTSLNFAVTSENHDPHGGHGVINEEEDMQRERFVSGITEDFSSDSESAHDGQPEFKTW